jgi:hypothetical protein
MERKLAVVLMILFLQRENQLKWGQEIGISLFVMVLMLNTMLNRLVGCLNYMRVLVVMVFLALGQQNI